jgi:hypothetical protein
VVAEPRSIAHHDPVTGPLPPGQPIRLGYPVTGSVPPGQPIRLGDPGAQPAPGHPGPWPGHPGPWPGHPGDGRRDGPVTAARLSG